MAIGKDDAKEQDSTFASRDCGQVANVESTPLDPARACRIGAVGVAAIGNTLDQGIDLVVVAPGKGQEFGRKLLEPGRTLGQQD